MEPIIHPLFPTPIYFTNLKRSFSLKELKEVEIHKKKLSQNTGNYNTLNSYILNEKTFIPLKKELELHIKDYFNRIYSPEDDKITPYITQSWLNYTDKNQYHHIHQHPNSLVSGVLYINADEKYDKIKFHDKQYNCFKITPKDYNMYNSNSWWFPVKKTDLVLFPSSTTHSVENKEGDNTRVSLAFNVFVKGILGETKELTELIL
tara:strand:- start:405 stop:1019 length:615 start_codon:yes stop_codon:yes gene_type:complete